jgi:hypothetical protein
VNLILILLLYYLVKVEKVLAIILALALSISPRLELELIWLTPTRKFELMRTLENRRCLDIMTLQMAL